MDGRGQVMNDTVKTFWDQQAVSFGSSGKASAPDEYYRDMEIRRIVPHLTDHASVLDIGCANGFSTFKFAAECPKSKFLGVDYSEPMIKQAIATMKTLRRTKNMGFVVGNVLELDRLHAKFDIIISERCLINLADWEEQKRAIMQMKYALNTGGRLLLVENTQEGLSNLNKLRGQFNLPAIKTRWHNQYLPQKELTAFLKKNFQILNVENIGNLYYILSRVVYAKLAQMEGKEPVYTHAINKIASELPSLPGYHFSPNFLYVLRAL